MGGPAPHRAQVLRWAGAWEPPGWGGAGGCGERPGHACCVLDAEVWLDASPGGGREASLQAPAPELPSQRRG